MVMFTVPFSSVVPVMFVPFGSVTFTGTFGIGLSSSVVMFTVMVPFLLSVTFIFVSCFTALSVNVSLDASYLLVPVYVMVMFVGSVVSMFIGTSVLPVVFTSCLPSSSPVLVSVIIMVPSVTGSLFMSVMVTGICMCPIVLFSGC